MHFERMPHISNWIFLELSYVCVMACLSFVLYNFNGRKVKEIFACGFYLKTERYMRAWDNVKQQRTYIASYKIIFPTDWITWRFLSLASHQMKTIFLSSFMFEGSEISNFCNFQFYDLWLNITRNWKLNLN